LTLCVIFGSDQLLFVRVIEFVVYFDPMLFYPVAVLGKNIWGPGPSSFGRQQRLSEITIEPIKNFGGLGKMWGLRPLAPA